MYLKCDVVKEWWIITVVCMNVFWLDFCLLNSSSDHDPAALAKKKSFCAVHYP